MKVNLIKFSLSIFLILFSYTLFRTSPAFATSSCEVLSTTPDPVTDQDKYVNLVIDTKGNLALDAKYDVWLDDYIQLNGPYPIETVGGRPVITIPAATKFNNNYKAGTEVNIDIRKDGDGVGSSPLESCSFKVEFKCSISISPDAPTPQTDILIKTQNAPGGSHKIEVIDNSGNNVYGGASTQCYEGTALNNGINLGKFSSGQYYTKIFSGCNVSLGDEICPRANFSTDPAGGTTGVSGTITSIDAPAPPPPPCAPGKLNSVTCTLINSAIGNIPTDITGFIKTFFSLVLVLSGSIALILIIISGYKLIVSRGNPEKVQEAREQLTAAIVGLMFVIFSLVALETIGVDIIGLPGFGSTVKIGP